ncbi:ABC transporter substrate-binding protein [Reyranella sp. CPCC 100927]|uniref:ABC transporter substrate-binding protein n=1 Tax=Reyranella sp. CPCC 100927 TaxID=2599616 RepID=UPI002105EEFE|nr:ABC transporter substrate-binding protein [Reyranella sp. CPCC 100927]
MARYTLTAAWLLGFACVLNAPASRADGMSDGVIRIGILNDRSGPYADLTGEGSVVAARMAAEEAGGTVAGVPIEIISADHQNKADVGAAVARRWFDAGQVDVVADLSNSAVGFATVGLAAERNKIVLNASGSADFTSKACTAISFQSPYNSYTNAFGLASAVTKRGLDSWFLVTVDYAFGRALATDIRRAAEANGGKVLGEVRHPVNVTDFSSYLLQAQSSGAKVIALANAGNDFVNSLKQAVEFGITKKQVVVAPTVFLTDINAIGLPTAQGLQFITGFYWDRDDASRAWAKRFFERHGAMPTMSQAGVYSMVRHYLRAVQAVGTDDGPTVAARMRDLPVTDFFGGRVRADGQFLHDMYLARVKKPAESQRKWDYYDILSTIPAEQAFRPVEQGDCPMIKK